MQSIEIWIRRISFVVGSVILLAMMAQVVIDVMLRSFAGVAFPATADLVGRYYMVAVSFLPLAMTEIDRRHIEATIFTRGLRGGARNAVLLLGFGTGILVFALLTWGAFAEAMTQTARGAYIDAGTMQFPTWPSYWILPLSFALMAMVLVIRLVELLTGRFVDAEHDPLEEIQSHGPQHGPEGV
jgi:TRAP-type C4-dicarboxylate transport system permease small subunit